MEEKELNDQEIIRREKLNKYVELGVDPVGHKYKVTHSASEIREILKNKTPAQIEKKHLEVSRHIPLQHTYW